MAADIAKDIEDYYHKYCELTIWFKKIILQADGDCSITIQDIAVEFLAERERVLQFVDTERRKTVRKRLNKVATGYYHKVSHWSRKQKITIDMV